MCVLYLLLGTNLAAHEFLLMCSACRVATGFVNISVLKALKTRPAFVSRGWLGGQWKKWKIRVPFLPLVGLLSV